jgi:hypothetical protein
MEQMFREALEAAKLVAKSYNHQVSVAHAEAVDAAWQRILALHRIAREPRGARLVRPPSAKASTAWSQALEVGLKW